jgi:hypothetical protein
LKALKELEMMVGTLAHISPHLLGLFMLALACVPLVFVWQDHHRREGEKKRMGELRREARVAAELRAQAAPAARGLMQGWAGEARR